MVKKDKVIEKHYCDVCGKPLYYVDDVLGTIYQNIRFMHCGDGEVCDDACAQKYRELKRLINKK